MVWDGALVLYRTRPSSVRHIFTFHYLPVYVIIIFLHVCHYVYVHNLIVAFHHFPCCFSPFLPFIVFHTLIFTLYICIYLYAFFNVKKGRLDQKP